MHVISPVVLPLAPDHRETDTHPIQAPSVAETDSILRLGRASVGNEVKHHPGDGPMRGDETNYRGP